MNQGGPPRCYGGGPPSARGPLGSPEPAGTCPGNTEQGTDKPRPQLIRPPYRSLSVRPTARGALRDPHGRWSRGNRPGGVKGGGALRSHQAGGDPLTRLQATPTSLVRACHLRCDSISPSPFPATRRSSEALSTQIHGLAAGALLSSRSVSRAGPRWGPRWSRARLTGMVPGLLAVEGMHRMPSSATQAGVAVR